MDTFSQTSNTQGDNENTILKSEKLDKSDKLEEMLKDFTINNAEYYVSGSANTNDAKGDPASNPKTVNHTSDRNKRKVTDTSNGILQKKLLSNWTLPIVTTTMDPRIGDRIVTYGGTTHTLETNMTKEVIMDAVRSSARVNLAPSHISWIGRDGSTLCDTCIDVRHPWANSPVLIGSTTMYPACGISGILQVTW